VFAELEGEVGKRWDECLSIATAIMYYTDMNEDTICFEILHSMKHCVEGNIITQNSTSLDTTKYNCIQARENCGCHDVVRAQVHKI